jgi:hypothetical protein
MQSVQILYEVLGPYLVYQRFTWFTGLGLTRMELVKFISTKNTFFECFFYILAYLVQI